MAKITKDTPKTSSTLMKALDRLLTRKPEPKPALTQYEQLVRAKDLLSKSFVLLTDAVGAERAAKIICEEAHQHAIKIVPYQVHHPYSV